LNRRAAALTAAALVAVLLPSVACRRSPAPAPGDGRQAETPETLDSEGDEFTLRLLFPGRGGRLHVEERTVPSPERRLELVRLSVTELMAGPSDPDLVSPFPPEVGLGEVLISEAGIVYIDLEAPDLGDPPSSGSLSELLEVYSVVNSVLWNVPDLSGVVLLWNGTQRPTFAGHLDTSRPLSLKEDLIAGRR